MARPLSFWRCIVEILLAAGFFILWLRRNIRQARRRAAVESTSRTLVWLGAFTGDLPGLLFLFSALAVLAPGIIRGEIVVGGSSFSATALGWGGLVFSLGLVTWSLNKSQGETWATAFSLTAQNFQDAAWLFLAVSFLMGVFRIPSSF